MLYVFYFKQQGKPFTNRNKQLKISSAGKGGRKGVCSPNVFKSKVKIQWRITAPKQNPHLRGSSRMYAIFCPLQNKIPVAPLLIINIYRPGTGEFNELLPRYIYILHETPS